MFKWLYEKIKIFKEREIRIFGLPVIQYGTRVLTDGTTEKYFRLFHKSLEHQFLDYILSFVPKEHDYIFLIRCNGLGENYLLNFMLDEMIQKKGMKNPCFVSHRGLYRDLFAMWNDIPFYKDPFLDVKCWNEILLHPSYRYKGKFFIVYHTTVEESRNFLSLDFSTDSTAHYLDHIRKQLGCQIKYKKPIISDDVIDSIDAKTSSLNKDKFVFFVPEAKSTHNIQENFWKVLAQKFIDKGYDVFVNTQDGVCDYGKSAKTSLSEMYYLASKAKAIISIRCGITEIVSPLPVPKHILYTNYACEDVSAEQMLRLTTIKKYPAVKPKTVFEYNTENTDLEEIANTIVKEVVK